MPLLSHAGIVLRRGAVQQKPFPLQKSRRRKFGNFFHHAAASSTPPHDTKWILRRALLLAATKLHTATPVRCL